MTVKSVSPCSRTRAFAALTLVCLLAATATSHAQDSAANQTRILLAKTWPGIRLSIIRIRAESSWRVVVEQAEAKKQFDIDMAASAPSDAYLLSSSVALIRADEPGNNATEVALVDLKNGRELQHLNVNALSISPNGRYLLFERRVPHLDREQQGSVLSLYDVEKAQSENRDASSASFLETGMPVFPDDYRRDGDSVAPPEAKEPAGRLVSVEPTWASNSRVVFGYSRRGIVSVVMLTLDEDGTVDHVTERALDVGQYVRTAVLPASDVVEFENIHIIASSNSGTRVRVRLGPADKARIRWLELELR